MSHQSLPSKFLTLYTVGYMVYTWEYTTVQQASRGVSYHSTLMWEGWEPLWTTILFELFILYTFFLHYLLFLTFNMQGHLFNISVKCRSYIFGPFIFHLVTCQSASEHHGTAGPHESVGVAGLCLKSLKSTRSKKTARACLSQVYKGLKRQVAPHPISEHISSSTLLEMLHCPTPDLLTSSLTHSFQQCPAACIYEDDVAKKTTRTKISAHISAPPVPRQKRFTATLT